MTAVDELETLRERHERLKRTKSKQRLRLSVFVLLIGALLLLGLAVLSLLLVQPRHSADDIVRVPLQLPLQSIYVAQRG
jgi:hypothetical protein